MFKVGLMNCKILFLKMWKLCSFQRLGSKLFHSTIVEGKNKIFKEVMLYLR